MPRRALIVGINNYENVSTLNSCVADAEAMVEVLSRHQDNSVNFDCRPFLAPGPERITRVALRKLWRELFHDFRGDVLFYFSGHGTQTETGGYLVTQEGTPDDPGLAMDDLAKMANDSSASTVLIILDCCFSGAAGNPAALQASFSDGRTVLREGVTILAASRGTQAALETGGQSVFTSLVLGALRGGAADIRGKVSAASIYGYAESALGSWQQRPLYKSHAANLEPVRLCTPKVTDAELRDLPKYFPHSDFRYQLDLTYEETCGAAKPAHVAIFKAFKRLQLAGLLTPIYGDDLYWAAERSFHVVLTELGRFYWQLVRNGRI
jgi:hypothetical protein